ncbi:MAG TPA: tripartite tricarboxylate transporter substrate binding protein [Burkholderiaceae bacterium]|nr:tripartite tricarboxylate transporter substrate binding protein [Burkholderiaceae bacterium]
MKSTLFKAVAAAVLATTAFAVHAQFPDRPIRLVVPFPPGGTTDVVARQFAPKAAEILGQPIIIDNRGGAGGSIATDLVAKAAPDGYTLLMPTNSHTANPFIYRKLPFDTAKDFVGVALIGDSPGLFVVNPQVPVRSLKEFVTLAKKSNPPLRFGSAGAGTYPHLSTELFKQQAGIEMEHIAYKGAGPALVDLLGGIYEFKVEGSTTAAQHVRSGKLVALGVTSKERLPQMADIPTVAEQGYPQYETNFWMGILVPAGTPKDVRAKLEAAFLKAVQDKEVAAKMEGSSVRVIGKSGAELDALIEHELKLWPPIVKKAGITAN